jgi:hypothetical protein
LKCFHHQYNPQNKTQQAQEVQKKSTEGDDAPIAESTKLPLHAEYRSKDGSQDAGPGKRLWIAGLRCAESDVGRLSKSKEDQASNPAENVA